METILLTIHLIVAIAMVTTILLQRSEGGALGIGGGAGGMMTARGAGDALSKTTKWLAIIFLANSLALGWISANNDDNASVIDQAIEQGEQNQENVLPEIPTVPQDGEG
ncbi:preprotein translocase subunit SecG [Kordiimonas aquimaris]|uniref:preprotein translocase subunit SecG n=1 Tax=Kordiimonas aquimaris TaxID=707591 RepID=UPI0021CE031A|nr:preprotein translocase subunit SecG [Kordiimonas aquimaris]